MRATSARTPWYCASVQNRRSPSAFITASACRSAVVYADTERMPIRSIVSNSILYCRNALIAAAAWGADSAEISVKTRCPKVN
jgi:hypothetical protein